MNLKFTITINNVNIWRARNGYKIITPLEIILNKLGIKKSTELLNKIFPDPDDEYMRDMRVEAKKEMSIKLLYKTEEERREIEEKTLELYGRIDYMIANKLRSIQFKEYLWDYSQNSVTENISKMELSTICCLFTILKVIDGELVRDYWHATDNVKNLDYYNIKNTLTREIESLWT